MRKEICVKSICEIYAKTYKQDSEAPEEDKRTRRMLEDDIFCVRYFYMLTYYRNDTIIKLIIGSGKRKR